MPERNIIGLVITLATASPVSAVATTEPMQSPARESTGSRRGHWDAAHAVVEMSMPKATRPNTISTTTWMMATASPAVTRAAKNSESGIGVSLIRRSTPFSRHLTITVARLITAEIMIERPMIPGSRKSM